MEMKPKPKPTQSKRRELARAIADMLFTDGFGNKAENLVMKGPEHTFTNHKFTGWSHIAVVRRIEQLLKKHGI